MEDSEIIELYFNRDEAAVTQTSAKYGRVLRRDCLSCAAQPGGLGGVRQ